jgi:hypothetical protein
MDIQMNESFSEEWWLAAMLPPLEVGISISLTFIREVDGEELSRTQKANSFLRRLSDATSYAQLVELFGHLEQSAVPKNNKPLRRVAMEMNRAAHVLSRAAKEVPDNMRQQITLEYGPDTSKSNQFEQAINEESSHPTFKILVGLAELDQGPFIVDGGQIICDPTSIAILRGSVPDIPAEINLLAALRTGLLIMQRLVGRQLQINQERIEASSLALRQLAVQVPDGTAALIRISRQSQASGSTSLGPMSPEPLALDAAAILHRALRISYQLLQGPQTTGAFNHQPSVSGNGPGPSGETKAGAEDPKQQTSNEGDAEQGAAGAARHSETSAADAVFDMGTLAAHTTDLADSLEMAWSAAMPLDKLEEAQQEMMARFNSLVVSIQRRVTASEASIRAAGIDTRLPADPLPLQEIARLSFEPDPLQRWRQLQLAELEALKLLLSALQPMRSPSGRRISFPSGEVETWWEAGAFELLRSCARLLANLSDQTMAAASAVTGSPAFSPSVGSFMEPLRQASNALLRGDVVGALVHAQLAIIERAAFDSSTVPEDLMDRLAEDARLASSVPILALLKEAILKISHGKRVDTGVATLLSAPAINLAQHLCLREPQIIRTALGLTGENGENAQP